MPAEQWKTYGAVPTAEIGELESQWPGLSMAEAYECHELRFSPEADEYARQRGHADARAYHEALTEHIRANGIVNMLGLGPAYDDERFQAGVVNGQHRYFAAVDLGLPSMPAGPNRIAPMPPVRGWDYPAEHDVQIHDTEAG